MPAGLLAAWLLAFGADAVTTHTGLGQGGHELVLTQNRWANDGILAGEAVGGALALGWLWKHGRTRTVVLLALAGIATHSYAAWQNSHP